MDVVELIKNVKKYMDKEVVLQGWIRNHRKQKEFGFISFSDGTFFTQIQIVYDNELSNFEVIQKYRVGSSIKVEGILVEILVDENILLKSSPFETFQSFKQLISDN